MNKNMLIKALMPMVEPKIEPMHLKGVELLDSIPLEEGETKAVIQVQTVKKELFAFVFALDKDFKPVRQIEINNKKSFKLKDILTDILTNL